MVNSKINNILIPNVTKLPSQKSVEQNNKIQSGETSEFKNLLESTLEQATGAEETASKKIFLSTHAMKRLQERNMNLDKDEYQKLQNALDKLKVKGGQDSLIITGKAAYIVDVPKSMIVTAIDKESLDENVFTKIDSTILMN